MSKPRLAEILGVEVNEVFTIKGETGREYSVDSCGVFYINGACESGDIYDLMYIINNPEVIVRKPKLRWTKKDVEDAKAIRRVMPWVQYVWRNMFCGIYQNSNSSQTLIDMGCFPSIAEGETVKLDDIINSEPVE